MTNNTTFQFVSVSELTPLLEQIRNDFKRENEFSDIMTLPQLCKYLGVTAPTIHKRINESNLPVSYALGEKSPRFLKNQIDNWLRDGK